MGQTDISALNRIDFGTFVWINIDSPSATVLERPWTSLGQYTTFLLILAGSSVPVIMRYVLFRKLRWL